MKDKFKVKLEAGQHIVYATTSGSSAYLNEAYVIRADADRVKIMSMEHSWPSYRPRPVWLRAPSRIVVVGWVNEEDLCDRGYILALPV